MQNKVLHLDKEGYENHLKSIDNLLINLGRIEEKMNDLKSNNFDKKEYEELINLKEAIKKRILDKRNAKIVFVEKNSENNLIDIGDVVKVKSYYSENDIEEEIFELVAGESDLFSEIEKLSIDSPKGKIIYNSKIGDIKYYSTKMSKVKVEILEKIDIKTLKKVL